MAYDLVKLCAMPETRNFQRPNGFKFFIDNLKDINYTVQQVSLPGLQFGTANQETPFVNVPWPGDKIVYAPLTIKFLVSEGLVNWRELYEWVEALGFPANYNQYKNLPNIKKNAFNISGIQDRTFEVSDAVLIFLNSSNNPEKAFRFIDCFPINISSVDMDVSTTDGTYVTASATFNYRSYEVVE